MRHQLPAADPSEVMIDHEAGVARIALEGHEAERQGSPTALIDLEDLERVLQVSDRWNLVWVHARYQRRYVRSAHADRSWLSRVILGLGHGRHMIVTYRDGNPLNLRKENLRAVPGPEFSAQIPKSPGQTGYSGVTLDKRGKQPRYRAMVGRRHLGVFGTPEEAAAAVQAARNMM